VTAAAFLYYDYKKFVKEVAGLNGCSCYIASTI